MSIIIIIVIMCIYVIYIGRGEPFNIALFVKKFTKLLVLIFTYFKDIGVCAAQKFRETDWSLTSS